jgi:hypothetical protein
MIDNPWSISIAGIVGGLLAWLVYSTVDAQEKHDHLFYSLHCCNQNDCKPAIPQSVRTTAEGYFVEPQNRMEKPAVLRYDDKRIKPSEDGRYHTCVNIIKRIRCLYVPPPSG